MTPLRISTLWMTSMESTCSCLDYKECSGASHHGNGVLYFLRWLNSDFSVEMDVIWISSGTCTSVECWCRKSVDSMGVWDCAIWVSLPSEGFWGLGNSRDTIENLHTLDDFYGVNM